MGLMRRREVESGVRWLLKRWWFWTGTGFMLVAVVVGYLVIPIGEARISQASCDKIQPGWTAAQVHEFLGSRRNPLDTMYLEVWGDEDGWIVVRFDPQEERVIETGFIPTDSSTYERMKRRIERRIRALWP